MKAKKERKDKSNFRHLQKITVNMTDFQLDKCNFYVLSDLDSKESIDDTGS